MKKIGTLVPHSAREIGRSRIGIGFECLDRAMWRDTPELYRAVGELGVKHARVQTGWFRCEKSPGVYEFDWLDSIVDSLREQGVEPWFNLGYGNRLYSPESPSDDAAGYPPVRTPEAREAWKRFVAALAEHFGSRVRVWEVWNEPDASGFWRSGPDAADYLSLVRDTAGVLRARCPGCRVVGGALAMGLSWWVGFAVVRRYLELGLASLIDAFTFHRYHLFPELNRPDDFALLRKMFDTAGGTHVELWQGESGCPSKSSPTEALSNLPLDETVQAKVALRSLATDLGAGVERTGFFHISDFLGYYRNGFIPQPNYFGLLTCDNPPRRKPAYTAVQSLCTLFDSETVPEPLLKLQPDLEAMSPEERFPFQEFLIRMKIGTFTRRGWPLVFYYDPADLVPGLSGRPPFVERRVAWNLFGCGKVREIERPVLIDPLTGAVFEPRRAESPNPFYTYRALELRDVPVRDYPLIVTDRAAVEIQGNSQN